MSEQRDPNGRFRPGCEPGPGRPRRVVEVEYLATLSCAATLGEWRAVADKAVQDAKSGDEAARAWLSKYLLRDKPDGLMDLAVAEHVDRSVDDKIAAEATSRECEQRQDDRFQKLVGEI